MGKQMEEMGMAKAFGSDMDAMVNFINTKSGRALASYKDMMTCAEDLSCTSAWATDASLHGQNATLVKILREVDGAAVVRCHAHLEGAWCHDPKAAHFNHGNFFVASVQPPVGAPVVGLVMCHEWPAGKADFFKDVTKCHTMPVGLVVEVTK